MWIQSHNRILLKEFLKEPYTTMYPNCEIESKQFDALNFMELAQKLVNDPLSDAFKFLVNSPTSSGGEDE